MNKIYISGPMTGKPEYNYPAFNQMAALLRSNGYTVFNPAEIRKPLFQFGSENELWIWYMKKAISMLMKADTVVLLPGWEKSNGVCIELVLAKELGYKIVYEPELTGMGIIF